MTEYEFLKWVHILSATLLFGTGLGTAFHGFFGQRGGRPEVAAIVMRNVVRADWLFTATSGVVQPVTGVLLARAAGYSLTEPWLVLTYILYAVAAVCWIPVAVIQIKLRDLAENVTQSGSALPIEYHHLMRIWFTLGWPAFIALVGVFYLMVARPTLW
jgi:uncharacterized membrane protein